MRSAQCWTKILFAGDVQSRQIIQDRELCDLGCSGTDNFVQYSIHQIYMHQQRSDFRDCNAASHYLLRFDQRVFALIGLGFF